MNWICGIDILLDLKIHTFTCIIETVHVILWKEIFCLLQHVNLRMQLCLFFGAWIRFHFLQSHTKPEPFLTSRWIICNSMMINPRRRAVSIFVWRNVWGSEYRKILVLCVDAVWLQLQVSGIDVLSHLMQTQTQCCPVKTMHLRIIESSWTTKIRLAFSIVTCFEGFF